MIDPRFYQITGPLSLGGLVDRLGGELTSDAHRDLEITSPASSVTAGSGEICFAEGAAKTAKGVSPEALACCVTPKLAEHLPENVVPVLTETPRVLLMGMAAIFATRKRISAQTEAVSPLASVAASAVVGPGVVIGPEAVIGDNVQIGPNAVIGPGVTIGEGTVIGPGVTIETAIVGSQCHIQSGATIGTTGFGVMPTPTGIADIEHYGRVVIGDRVSIGANCCFDRGVFDDTVVGDDAKFDNMVQIAHNVRIGRGVMMAAFGGISGSVTIGDGAMLGGRVGIADHIHIGANVRLAADAAVMKDIPDGETWGGTPAKPLRQLLREVAWLTKQAKAPTKKTSE